MNLRAYLRRIGVTGPVRADARTLKRLHRQHLFTVPFENLSIHMDEPVSLGLAALYDKIVQRRRGGFCYELNGLFADLLRRLGYRVTLLSAGVAKDGGGFGPEFDHLLLLVQLDRRWMVDVGFGENFKSPLDLDAVGAQRQGSKAYRIQRRDRFHLLQERSGAGRWKDSYRFTLRPRELSEFAGMCRYHQTSPDSHFTRNRVCSLATPSGRKTLSGMKLIESGRNGVQRVSAVTDEREYRQFLREQFGVRLPKGSELSHANL
ncbi:MAG TPA: arylamine N-acetyltransferase [Dongiaceae bacterium]